MLPFKYSGTNADLAALAEGLSEEIVTGLLRFSYLRVIARGATLRYVTEAVDARAVGKEIGARYVLEGSLRQAGSQLRVAVQLVDAATGAHLWAEAFNRPFNPDEILSLQDELVPRIVSSVADAHGVLPRTMSEALRSKAPEQLSPYEAVLRSFGYGYRMTPDEHAAVRAGLERAVEQEPDNADAWAMLSLLYGEEYSSGFNVQPDPIGRALRAARRAADIAPSHAMSYNALARALFFRKEFEAFRPAAEQAVALNPLNSPTLVGMGAMTAYAGDWERGCALVERAVQLNPRHPGWYWFPLFYRAYRNRDYQGAVNIALKINLPGFFAMHEALAAAYGQLGNAEAAGNALRELLRIRPDYPVMGRERLEKWLDAAVVDHMMEGLRKAGLEVPTAASPAPRGAADASRSPGSGAARCDEGFWVAVLPFKPTGPSADLAALAEGLSEEIVTGLSRYSYLRVIARSSTSRYANAAVDVRAVAKEIGARYVMEGTVRQAGSMLRVAVQLVDAITGAHLWAESYTRPFKPDAIFELQDEVAPLIVCAVGDMHGVLPHSMSDAVRSKDSGQLTPYEAVLRGFGYYERFTSDEHADVRALLERAVQQAPGHADAWALLSVVYADEYKFGFNVRPDALERSLRAARRAVDAGPSNALAHAALTVALFFRKELAAARTGAERAVALNPNDAATVAAMGETMAYAGDWERGCALIDRARQLNPRHPGSYWFGPFFHAYRKGDFSVARDIALKINLPGFFYAHATLAAACGQLGEHDSANRALRELLILKPDFAVVAREELGKRWDPELVELLIDGLRMAGLDLPAPAGAEGPRAAASAPPALGSDAAESSLQSSTKAHDATVAIAVLPFADMSPAKDQQYLCEGMAEEIMNALVRIDGIHVASRTSAFRAQRGGGDLSAIARALSVGHVLDGSVRTSGSRLRVTAQLTDVASGFQLWSERFDRDTADVFAVQDEIAAGVVEAVKARLAPGERVVHARPHAGNLEAYRCYLNGRYLRHTKNDHGAARRAFEEAVRIDPTHAPSWVGVAEVTVLGAFYNLIPPKVACARSREALATAQRLQGESVDALAVEGFVAFVEKNWHASECAFRRAVDLHPDYVPVLGPFGMILSTRGRYDEAAPLLERARRVDPLAAFPFAATGIGLLSAGRLQEAARYLDEALSFERENTLALEGLCMAQIARGRFEQGIATAMQALAVTRRAPFFLGLLGWALAAAGRQEEARDVLQELRRASTAGATVVSQGWVLAALGETDAAFELLARAEEECQPFLYFTGLPTFDPLRGDARFDALLARLGLPTTTEA